MACIEPAIRRRTSNVTSRREWFASWHLVDQGSKRMRIARPIAAGILSCMAAGASAASPSEPTETIQVEGSRAEVRKQVETFVAQVTRSDGELIGRWRDALCPLIAGLSDAQNEIVRNRMLEVEA